jgi:hypothetical protein
MKANQSEVKDNNLLNQVLLKYTSHCHGNLSSEGQHVGWSNYATVDATIFIHQ